VAGGEEKLSSPLPGNIQTELNEIGKTLAANLNQIGNLDNLTENYQPLGEIYQKERAFLQTTAGNRNKGLPPLPLSTEPNSEQINIAVAIFTAPDSVATAKPKNLIQKIWGYLRITSRLFWKTYC